jgi:hypothetical protein
MKYTNNFNLPQSIVDAIIKNTYDLSQNNPNVTSITTLINPPRIRHLTIRHWANIEEDVSTNFWRLLGSAVHEVLSRIHDTNRLIEERLFVDMITKKLLTVAPDKKLEVEAGHFYIAGKPDLYEDATKSIEDYKVTSVWAVSHEKREWTEQVNCYAWLYHKLGFKIEKAFINAILRDWRKSEWYRNSEKGYPPFPFKRIEIELWPTKVQEKFLDTKLKEHQATLLLSDEDLPICSEEDRWKGNIRCKDYCFVNKFCSFYKKEVWTEDEKRPDKKA